MDVIELAVNVILIKIQKVKKPHFMDVIELAVNVIIIKIQKVKKEHFMDVIELAVNVIIIQILESEGNNMFQSTVFRCNRTSCKRYVHFRK